ncbi:hypothetical protein [Streptomyces sp. NPDC054765]
MIRAVAFDVGETLIRDDRGWGAWADWLGVNRHTLSALVGAVVAQGRDNADALRLVRPGIGIEAERAAMERAGQGEFRDESDLYPDVRPALAALPGRRRGGVQARGEGSLGATSRPDELGELHFDAGTHAGAREHRWVREDAATLRRLKRTDAASLSSFAEWCHAGAGA